MRERFQASFTCFTDELIRLRGYNYYISMELISSSALFNCIIRLIKCEWTSHSALARHTAVSSPCWGKKPQRLRATCAHAGAEAATPR